MADDPNQSASQRLRQALGESFGNGLIYLAAPYASPDRGLMAWRLAAANQVAGRLIAQGWRILSPLTHSAALERIGHRPPEGDWYAFDLDLLKACHGLAALQLPGWERSRGMALEVEQAVAQRQPICWLPLRCRELPAGMFRRLTQERADAAP